MSRYTYKGHQIVSGIVRSDVVPARVSVKVWKTDANQLFDVPCYFTTSLDDAMKWIDAHPAPIKWPVVSGRQLPRFL